MTAPPSRTITRAEVAGSVVDVRVTEGRIVGVGPDLRRPGDEVVDAGGAALLPGLHDHHVHLLAMAGAPVGGRGRLPRPAAFAEAVARADREVPAGRWLRVVGVDERHGPMGADRLDRLAPGRPVRAQHRSGAAWALSRVAQAAVGPVGADADGWIHRADAALRVRWAEAEGRPDLAAVGRRLAELGVTGVTDATPFDDDGGFGLLAAARRAGHLPQQIAVTGGPALAAAPAPTELERGPVKVVVEDHALPSPADLVAAFRSARHAGRAVAVHCVTRAALVLALVAWDEVGAEPGDRIEHGSVVPLELVAPIAERGLTVVTQPGFVHARGDRYLAEVEPDDVPHLYRCGSLIAAGVPVAGSTDAPFGPDDPWLAVRTAVERTTSAGRRLGADEAIAPDTALERFLSPLDSPGGRARHIGVGGRADLVLLDRPLADALAEPSARHVRTTWIGGMVVHDRG
ncbi:MAG: amidohydrolase family protein [Acidimicrobiales bacterium]